jgi:recombination protein RecR
MFNNKFSSSLLEKAVMEISRLPGIGSKTALRLALHLLRQEEDRVEALAESLVEMRRGVHYCQVCYNICDDDRCEICSNPTRDSSLVCVVENVQDVMAIENTMQYRGLYHVLGGVISPMDGIGPSDLQIESLVERVNRGGVEEVILALSPTMEGDTTNYYIYRKLEDTGVKVTVIARGIAQNDELQYTDEVTLGRALAGRVPFGNS